MAASDGERPKRRAAEYGVTPAMRARRNRVVRFVSDDSRPYSRQETPCELVVGDRAMAGFFVPVGAA